MPRKTYGEKDFKGVQISYLSKDKIKVALAVEAWAEECQRLHRRECTESQCGGRSKIWWLVRHPEVSPQHANETAKAYVRERMHVCSLVLDRLAEGMIPWIDGELSVYENRTDEEIMQLLGREFTGSISGEVRTVSMEQLTDPFPAARAAMPLETAAQRRARENREDWKRRKQDVQERADRGLEAPRGYARPRGTGNGLADATAALRKRD